MNDILYYPETLGFLMQRFGIWEAARISIFNNVTSSDFCVIMFHAYDLPDEDSWKVLENLLGDCKQNQDIHLYTFSGLKDAGIDGSKTRYNANKLEGFLQKYRMPKGVFCSTFHCYTIHILNALLYLLLVIIITLISQRIAQTLLGKRVCLIVGLIGAIIVCSFALFHLIGPLKLWGLDFVMCIVTLAIAIADYVRHK